jgi:hypothetical protein
MTATIKRIVTRWTLPALVLVAGGFVCMKTRRQLTAPPNREPVDSAMTGMRAQWESGLETLSGIRQWKLRLQLAGRTAIMRHMVPPPVGPSDFGEKDLCAT